MALNWDLTGITDRKEWMWYRAAVDIPSGEITKGEKMMNPITHQLIWTTMIIGIGRWTKANIKEVFYRIRSYELACGPLFKLTKNKADSLNGGQVRKDTFDEDGYLSYAEVAKHVGLSTNVGNETNVWWRRKLDDIMRREVSNSILKTQGDSK